MAGNSEEKKAISEKLQGFKRNIFQVLRRWGRRALPLAITLLNGFSATKAQEASPDDNLKNANNKEASLAKSQNKINENQLVVFDVETEINKRADWFVGNILKSAKKHLSALKNCRNKTFYVKKEFFDVVSPIRNLSGSTPYCITALNRCLIDANRMGGDLSEVLPNPHNKECYSANECNSFIKFLCNKGHGDCIDFGDIDFDKLEPGDIILTLRNRRGSRHAQFFEGKFNQKYYCISFNSDAIRELKNTRATVVHTRKIVEKEIKRNLERENLVNEDDGYVCVMPYKQAMRILSYLNTGRNKRNDLLISERLRSMSAIFNKQETDLPTDIIKLPPLEISKDDHITSENQNTPLAINNSRQKSSSRRQTAFNKGIMAQSRKGRI